MTTTGDHQSDSRIELDPSLPDDFEPTEERPSKAPVGSGSYVVRQGECLSSIADRLGFFWKTLWDDPRNASLKTKRVNPDVLCPGDLLTIPDKESKQVERPTEARHRFRRRGVPVMLRLRILDMDGKPRAGEDFILEVEGRAYTGTSDANGDIQHSIPPSARSGKLLLNDGAERYDLVLGQVDPVSEVRGVQERLKNLGYGPGPLDGKYGPLTAKAVRRFQRDHDLPATGVLSDETRQRLESVHGS